MIKHLSFGFWKITESFPAFPLHIWEKRTNFVAESIKMYHHIKVEENI